MRHFPQIASPLHIEPEIRAVTEHAGENESCRRGHIAAIVAQLIDVLGLRTHGFSQRALRQADRLHEFLDQNFANRRRFAFCHQHGLPRTWLWSSKYTSPGFHQELTARLPHDIYQWYLPKCQRKRIMSATAKLFMHGRSQAVRLPKE